MVELRRDVVLVVLPIPSMLDGKPKGGQPRKTKVHHSVYYRTGSTEIPNTAITRAVLIYSCW